MKKALLLLIPLLVFTPPKLNNTCKNYSSYFFIFFSNDCYHNPDLEDDIQGIIRRHVGVYETQEVQTDDGYILNIFRIPQENPKGVILFQHSLGTDARLWVSQYNESIAFLFWRAGYDVWLGNARGNFFSKKHISLERDDPLFWNFTSHEIGYYDIHAIIKYVKRQTNTSKIIYVGYSLGGVSGMVYVSSRDKEAADSLKAVVTIASSTHTHFSCTSLIKYRATIFYPFQESIHLANPQFVLNQQEAYHVRAVRFLLTHFPCKKCVLYLIYLFTGWSQNDMEPDLINMIIKTFASEWPLKILYHHYQISKANSTFRPYDYGKERNLVLYGREEPPPYRLDSVKVPVFIVSGQNDNIDCPPGPEVLFNKLPKNSTQYGRLEVEGFNHVDFIYGRYRNERIYYKILEFLQQINQQN